MSTDRIACESSHSPDKNNERSEKTKQTYGARLPEANLKAEEFYCQIRRDAAQKSATDGKMGLALSGGGIRSASFNLGFVQRLIEGGKFRDVDYLSTVSGGGYLGGFLASVMAGGGDDDLIKPNEAGRQPPAVRRLLRRGRYMKRLPSFLNRYLFGLVILNIWIFCGIAASGAGTAFLFRLVDKRCVINVVHALGFPGDILRAFFPAFLITLIWLLIWAVRYYWQRSRGSADTPRIDRATRIISLLILVSLAFGFVSLLVTGDISVPLWQGHDGISNRLTTMAQFLTVILAVLQISALIPALRLERLVRSGAKPRGPLDSVIFNAIGPAIVFGLPLLGFGWFAREDVAGTIRNVQRDIFHEKLDHDPFRELSMLHVRDWNEFWSIIRQRAEHSGLERKLLAAAEGATFEHDKVAPRRWLAESSPPSVFEASLHIEQDYQNLMASLPLVIGFYKFTDVRRLRLARDESQQAVIEAVNSEIATTKLLPEFSLSNESRDERFPADRTSFADFELPLRANIDETTTSSFITVEGEEVIQHGRSWKARIRAAACCWL